MTQQQTNRDETLGESSRETLSALIDGEAQELELRRLLREDQAAVDDHWRRLQRQQAALNSDDERMAFAHLDISAAVSAALADEPALSEQPAEGKPVGQQSERSAWWRPMASVAVAAGVAAVVVFGVGDGAPWLPGGGSEPETEVAASSAPGGSRAYPAFSRPQAGSVTVGATPIVAPRYEGERSEEPPQISPEAIARFQEYLKKHTERAALNNGQGVMSYARSMSAEEQDRR